MVLGASKQAILGVGYNTGTLFTRYQNSPPGRATLHQTTPHHTTPLQLHLPFSLHRTAFRSGMSVSGKVKPCSCMQTYATNILKKILESPRQTNHTDRDFDVS